MGPDLCSPFCRNNAASGMWRAKSAYSARICCRRMNRPLRLSLLLLEVRDGAQYAGAILECLPLELAHDATTWALHLHIKCGLSMPLYDAGEPLDALTCVLLVYFGREQTPEQGKSAGELVTFELFLEDRGDAQVKVREKSSMGWPDCSWYKRLCSTHSDRTSSPTHETGAH